MAFRNLKMPSIVLMSFDIKFYVIHKSRRFLLFRDIHQNHMKELDENIFGTFFY